MPGADTFFCVHDGTFASRYQFLRFTMEIYGHYLCFDVVLMPQFSPRTDEFSRVFRKFVCFSCLRMVLASFAVPGVSSFNWKSKNTSRV